MNDGGLIPPHGGYRRLRSFRCAQLVYDATVIFCNRFVDKRSRTYDQMIQAARSGVQNIAEGSMASAISKKTEMKLTGVARASLEELLLALKTLFSHALEELVCLASRFLEFTIHGSHGIFFLFLHLPCCIQRSLYGIIPFLEESQEGFEEYEIKDIDENEEVQE